MDLNNLFDFQTILYSVTLPSFKSNVLFVELNPKRNHYVNELHINIITRELHNFSLAF